MLKFPRDLYSDVRVEDVAETTLVLEDGELKQCTESRRRGAFVRVYDGKRWYNSATTSRTACSRSLIRWPPWQSRTRPSATTLLCTVLR